MPISRDAVRRVCSPAEFELYRASLRLNLATLLPEALRTHIARAREMMKPAPDRGAGVAARRGRFRAHLRKDALMAAALARFERRLRALEAGA
jgi:hypothetical protein